MRRTEQPDSSRQGGRGGLESGPAGSPPQGPGGHPLHDQVDRVLALNGVMLVGVAVYALINAISSLLAGGRELAFDTALAFGPGARAFRCRTLA